jgi:hypothetical protein|tara:strand:+ start:150 stop:821 length:672 start_codon:yes stop_codon:yes gene_type:complete
MAYFGENATAKGDDSQMSVRFYKKLIQKKLAKNQASPGLKESDYEWVNKDVDYVEIKNIGNRLQVYDQPVREEDKQRFAHQWNMYQTRQDQAPKGLPLHTCPALNDADLRMLETYDFVTVEQVINMSDTQSQKFHAGRAIQKRVADWYETYVVSVADGRVEDLERELSEMKTKLDSKPETPPEDMELVMKRLVDDGIAKAMENSTKPVGQKRGPGRPPKQEAA